MRLVPSCHIQKMLTKPIRSWNGSCVTLAGRFSAPNPAGGRSERVCCHAPIEAWHVPLPGIVGKRGKLDLHGKGWQMHEADG